MPKGQTPIEELSWLQWRPEGDLTDNQDAFEELLRPFEARMKRDGDRLLVQAWGGLNTHLEPGDCVVLDGDKLGIVRAADASDLQH